MSWEIKDLQLWDEAILKKAKEFGLDPYPQEFEVCDYEMMIGYMAYSGMLSRYPHWSFGKAYERTKTFYNYGITGLPYEMVINSNPCLAFLMVKNTLALQILIIAHVYGHNDFFRNNFTFKATNPELTIEMFKNHADRIRSYVENPSIGAEKVEEILDAAHSLAFHCGRNLAVRKLTSKEQKERIINRFRGKIDPYQKIHKREKVDVEALKRALAKTPLEPEEDLLLFIRDNSLFLEEWERDILTIIHEEARYFIPQIQTKIMNEGWASFWHKKLLDSLDLPQGIKIEVAVHHNRVVVPPPTGGINPYHIGFEIWDSLRIWYDGSIDENNLNRAVGEHNLFKEMKIDFEERDCVPPDTGKITGLEKMFEVSRIDRDESFIRQFLTPPTMRRTGLFVHQESEFKDKVKRRVVTNVSDKDGWRIVRDVFIQELGMNSFPVVKTEDANYQSERHLFLKHYYDGRELEIDFMKKTLEFIKKLWEGKVTLETVFSDKPTQCFVTRNGELKTNS